MKKEYRYQTYLLEIKSPQRDEAAAFNECFKCYQHYWDVNKEFLIVAEECLLPEPISENEDENSGDAPNP